MTDNSQCKDQKIAVVTGGNRGIGFAIAKNLAKKFNGLVYLTARNEESAKKAVHELELKFNITNCRPFQLDITDKVSVAKIKAYLEQTHDGLDILINNAGVICTPDNSRPLKQQLEDTVDTNYFGTLNLCTALFPLLRTNSRVVNVTSDWGCIRYIRNETIKKKLLSPNLTCDAISSIMNEYVRIAQSDAYQNEMGEAYMVSKNGLNALSVVQQRLFDEGSSGTIVSAVHPGEVTTDMNQHHGTILPDEGSETIVYLALREESAGVPGGKFWYEKKILDWDDINLDLSVFH